MLESLGDASVFSEKLIFLYKYKQVKYFALIFKFLIRFLSSIRKLEMKKHLKPQKILFLFSRVIWAQVGMFANRLKISNRLIIKIRDNHPYNLEIACQILCLICNQIFRNSFSRPGSSARTPRPKFHIFTEPHNLHNARTSNCEYIIQMIK